MDSARTRTMTEKGQELFHTTIDKHIQALKHVTSDITDYCIKLTSGEFDTGTLDILKHALGTCIKKSDDYIEFLNRTKTDEATRELDGHTKFREDLVSKVENIIQSTIAATKGARPKLSFKEPSVKSHKKSSRKSSSKASLGSSNSSSVLRQKAKISAEAARKRLEFVREESDLMTQKAEYEAACIIQKAHIDVKEKGLSARKDAAVAIAELKAIDDETESEISDNVSESVKFQLTENYVAEQNDILGNDNDNKGYVYIAEPSQLDPSVCSFKPHNPPAQKNVNQTVTPVRTLDRDSINNVDFAKFLFKKDLLTSRLHKFDDCPENYVSWKDTFKCVVNEISASAAEELDLLLQYTGQQSSKQVKSIKVANAGNPSRALERAWNRLDSRYGSPEKVESALKKKLSAVQKITYKDKSKLFELSDVLSEIRAVKEKPEYSALLSFYDTAVGVNPTISKLPVGLQSKWRDRAASYKRTRHVIFPPFTFFCDFVHEMAEVINDPSFDFEFNGPSYEPRNRDIKRNVSVAKTEIVSNNNISMCIIHKANHSLNECRAFRHKTLDDRRSLLKQHGVCFRCCIAKHLRKDCHENIKCLECNETSHTTAMHVFKLGYSQDGIKTQSGASVRTHGEEKSSRDNVLTKCTEICEGGVGKSCAKIVLLDIFHVQEPNSRMRIYAIIDEQSNSSLVHGDILDYFGTETESRQYSLSSCSGKVMMSGRRASGFVVQSLDGQKLELPTLIECDMIPNDRNEIPTRDVAANYAHLASIAQHIPPLDAEAKILLLIGRDLMPAHYVLDQKIGEPFQPYAQRLKLGWIIVGESCLDGAHVPRDVNSMKTYIHQNGRASMLEPCSSKFHVSDSEPVDTFLFRTTKDDNKPSLSVEDQRFLELMSTEMQRDDKHNWVAPLPFKQNRKPLPNNRTQAINRARSFDASLQRDPVKRQHVLDFMQALFENGHAERASELDQNTECWYLPLFGIYHPQKKDRIRIVFDSSAKFQGLSLNDVLMTGPNLTNNLLGVLLRFRTEKIAVIADLQQMFYSFYVRSEHRDYLRFLWHENNDLTKELVDFRMKVHVFGNSPSPAVATCGLQKTADIAGETSGKDIKEYIYRSFYVDDALSAHSTSEEAVSLLKRAQSALLEEGNLRLHKICSNSKEVLSAFEKDDLAKDLKEINFDVDYDLPIQRSLGVCWNLRDDAFTYRVTQDEKPFTRRGVLSIINGLYDPLGFASPVTLTGKLLLREAMTEQLDWDQPLPDEFRAKFETWKDSLKLLEHVQIPRTYGGDLSDIHHRDLLVFSDASEKAVAAVAYVRTIDDDGQQKIRFVLGKAKVAPKHGHTIPRLELCAAVLGVEIFETIQEELGKDFENITFFTDSKVTLGYIYNETKRFFVYVRNRVDRVRKSTSPTQWKYVPSKQNPADDATRNSVSSVDLPNSLWLKGPHASFIDHIDEVPLSFALVTPDDDCEVRTLKTTVNRDVILGSHRFEHFSTWTSLIRAITTLKTMARTFLSGPGKDSKQVTREECQHFILQAVQEEFFADEISALSVEQLIPRNSKILNLSPYLDAHGLLRVGGRLKNANLSTSEANPIIIPKHHIAILIVRYFHEQIFHQGRQFTENAIRKAGFWLIGGKRIVTSYIFKCVRCRHLRGKQEFQRMADLPFDRLDPAPPFSYVGIDVFGPWTISTRRTRGGQSNSKRWALLVTCLVVRAVHIEILEEMTSSCFINALRRFCAIRGEVKIIRSDCGTNFIGAVKDLNVNVISVEDRPVKQYLTDKGINWIFNPPHSSHMGGVWERMIGVARRIIDALLLNVKQLTHEMLATLFAEVSSIINSRPLLPISYDPEVPFPLTPATILTMKTDHTVQSFRLEDFSSKDLFKKQWKSIQHLANQFWYRWQSEFLPTLQSRKKWQQDRKNLQEGDIVLMRDKSLHRNDWPVGIITKTHTSDDNRVRKVDVRLGKDRKVFTRPVNEVIVLLTE